MKKKTKYLVICLIALTVITAVSFVILVKVEERKVTEKIEDIKDDLGNGTYGNIVEVKEDTDDEGNRTYTFTYTDGDEKVITIRPASEDEEGLILQESGDNIEEPVIPGKKDDGNNGNDEEEAGTAYERYNLLSASEKEAFYNSFDTPEDFYGWYSKAKKEYDSLHIVIEVGNNEVVDIGKK